MCSSQYFRFSANASETPLLSLAADQRICHPNDLFSRDHEIASESGPSASSTFINISVHIELCISSSDPRFSEMSVSSTSTMMLRRALRAGRLTPVSDSCARTVRPRPATFAPLRTVASAARLPTITASETRRRPTVRPYQQPIAQSGVVGSPSSKRTIFIQTENTPNPDVSPYPRKMCVSDSNHSPRL